MRFRVCQHSMLTMCYVALGVCNLIGTPRKDDWSMIMEVEVENPEEKAGKFTSHERMHVRNHSEVILCGNLKCRNKARCVIQPASAQNMNIKTFKCLCAIGYHGLLCAETNDGYKFPKIEEGGYLQFAFPGSGRKSVVGELEDKSASGPSEAFLVGFEMKPQNFDDGQLVVYHQSEETNLRFLLTLERNIFVFRLSDSPTHPPQGGVDDLEEIRHPRPISNGSSWVTVSFGRESNGQLFLEVNNDRQLLNPSNLSLGKKHIPAPWSHAKTYIFFGGHPFLTDLRNQDLMLGKHLKHGFVGCFQHIRINGNFVDPRRRPYVGDAVDGFGLSDCASELCNGVDCASNGTCAIVSGSEYECRCPLGTGGSNCRTANEVHLPQYNGRSYTEYTGLRGTSHSKTTLSLSFKPTAPTGLLLYQGFGEDRRGDFVAVLLMHSFLEVIFDLGSGPAFLRNPSPVAMGTWHKLHLWLIGRQGFLLLDGTKQPETTFSVGPLVQLTLSHHLFLGFHPDVDKVSVYLLEHFNQFAISQLIGFRGCLQELLINGYPVRLIGDAISGINVVNCASHPCAELSSACGEFGECQPDGDDFTCSCRLGHTGRRCQMSYNPGLMSRISFTSSAFLEFSSPKLMQTFASPHFDLLMDIKPDDSKGSTGVEQILLALITGSPSEGYALVVYMTTQRYLRQSWIHYSKFTGRKVFHHVKSSDGNISIGNLDAGMKNVEEIRLATHVWHRIRLLRRSYSLVIYLNGSHIETQDLYIDKLPTLQFSKLFVGGVDATVNLSPHINESLESDKIGSVVLRLMPSVSGFTGCLEKLRINGMSINAADSTSGRNIGTC